MYAAPALVPPPVVQPPLSAGAAWQTYAYGSRRHGAHVVPVSQSSSVEHIGVHVPVSAEGSALKHTSRPTQRQSSGVTSHDQPSLPGNCPGYTHKFCSPTSPQIICTSQSATGPCEAAGSHASEQ